MISNWLACLSPTPLTTVKLIKTKPACVVSVERMSFSCFCTQSFSWLGRAHLLHEVGELWLPFSGVGSIRWYSRQDGERSELWKKDISSASSHPCFEIRQCRLRAWVEFNFEFFFFFFLADIARFRWVRRDLVTFVVKYLRSSFEITRFNLRSSTKISVV